MSRSIQLVSLCSLLAACGKPPVEAPAELSELLVFLTANFENEEIAELEAGALSLEGFMLAASADLDDRASTPSPITQADLGGIPSHAGFDPSVQIPVAVSGESAFDLEQNLRIVAETNHVCIESATTKYFARSFESDLSCFLDGSCATLLTSNEVRKESLVADIWYDVFKEYRRFQLEDGREVMLARSWIDQVFTTDSGGGSWDQLVGLEAWIEDGGRTKRFYTLWSSVQVGGLGDDFYSALVRDGIDQGYGYADDYLADFTDELCREDRDREYDRE